MKLVYKCDFCDYTGTQEEVMFHEKKCGEHRQRNSCFTCSHAGLNENGQYKCSCGVQIPKNKIYEFCPKYDAKETTI